MIGEIGGDLEIRAAEFVKHNIKKPVAGFIAGQTAPKGKRMGHAGAIISGSHGTAAEKMDAMRAAGITVAEAPSDIGKAIATALMDMAGHNSDFALTRSNDTWAVCANKPGNFATFKCFFDWNHIENRNSLGDADDQFDFS